MTTGGAIEGGIALILFGLVTQQLVNLSKLVLAKDVNGVITNVVAWGVAFGTLLLFANSDASNVVLPIVGQPLSSLSTATLALVAIVAMAGAGAWYDRTKARDNSQSAAYPSLASKSDA